MDRESNPQPLSGFSPIPRGDRHVAKRPELPRAGVALILRKGSINGHTYKTVLVPARNRILRRIFETR